MSRRAAALLRALAEVLHGRERLLDILVGCDSADGRGDLAVRRDDEGRALRKAMADLDAAAVLLSSRPRAYNGKQSPSLYPCDACPFRKGAS